MAIQTINIMSSFGNGVCSMSTASDTFIHLLQNISVYRYDGIFILTVHYRQSNSSNTVQHWSVVTTNVRCNVITIKADQMHVTQLPSPIIDLFVA